MEINKLEQVQTVEQVKEAAKLPYTSPKLSVFGTLKEITHSGGSVTGDGLGTSFVTFDSLPPTK